MTKKKKVKSSQLPAETVSTSAVEAVRVDEHLSDISAPPAVEAVTVTKEPKLPKAIPDPSNGPRKYRVSLNCPTPLRDKSLVLEAEGEGEATKVFLKHNGISGSDHPITVVEVLKCH